VMGPPTIRPWRTSVNTTPSRCAFCGPADELEPAALDACADCLTPTIGPIESSLLAPAHTMQDTFSARAIPAPPIELLVDLLELNGGVPVSSGVAQLVWQLVDQLVDMEEQLDDVTDVLQFHRAVSGDEEPWETVQNLVEAADEYEAVSEALLAGGYLQGETASEVVRDLVATAAAAEAASEVLAEVGLRTWDRDLGEAVDDMVARSQQLQEDLVEMERQSIDRGQRYYRERQYRVNVAAVARRVLRRLHAASHPGPVASCETCGADWVVLEEASGITAPEN
jgi:Ni/Co efflux regulator RcnB